MGGRIESQFLCPYCNTYSYVRTREQISQTGWIIMIVLLLSFPFLFWIGLLMKEKTDHCANCNRKLTSNDKSMGMPRASYRSDRVIDLPSDNALRTAKNLERAERWEDAALIYEKVEMWEEAGRCRRRGRGKTVKHVHVDANELFTQIKKQGLAVTYDCPSCGGVMTIDGKGNLLRRCPFCGTGVDTQVLNSAVNDLSH